MVLDSVTMFPCRFKMPNQTASSGFRASVVATWFSFVSKLEQSDTGESPVFTGQIGFTPYFWMSDRSKAQSSHQGSLPPFPSRNTAAILVTRKLLAL